MKTLQTEKFSQVVVRLREDTHPLHARYQVLVTYTDGPGILAKKSFHKLPEAQALFDDICSRSRRYA